MRTVSTISPDHVRELCLLLDLRPTARLRDVHRNTALVLLEGCGSSPQLHSHSKSLEMLPENLLKLILGNPERFSLYADSQTSERTTAKQTRLTKGKTGVGSVTSDIR